MHEDEGNTAWLQCQNLHGGGGGGLAVSYITILISRFRFHTDFFFNAWGNAAREHVCYRNHDSDISGIWLKCIIT